MIAFLDFFIIFCQAAMWQCQQIDFKIIKTQNKPTVYQSVIFLWNSFIPDFRFRCQAKRENTVDRLVCTIVDEIGNNLQFDELSTKETVALLNRNCQPDFPNIVTYFQDGFIKILMKQKFYHPNVMTDEKEPETLLSNEFFNPRIEKLKKYLENLSPDFEKCNKIRGKKGFTGYRNMYGFSSNQDKSSKKLQLQFYKSVEKVLKSKNSAIKKCLKQIKRKKDGDPGRHNQIDEENDSGDQNLSFVGLDAEKFMYESNNQVTTGCCEEKTNLFEIHEIQLNDASIKKSVGGACTIDKKQIKKFTYLEDGYKTSKTGFIAIKKPKVIPNSTQKNSEYEERFFRQRKILQHLNKTGKKQYLLNYYYQTSQEEKLTLYIDFIELNLNEFLYYYRQFLSVSQIFSICKQILQIVQDLHENKVVHRDLKPSNFMVDTQGGIHIKLIDFSDSWIIGEEKAQEKLCGTLPYSPLQSSKHCKKHEVDGIHKPQIDYWSVGILLHQIFYGYIPLTYSPCLAKDIHTLWINQFLYTVNSKKKSGIRVLQSGFQLLNILMVRVNPGERLEIGKAYIILSFMEKYYNDFIDNLE